MFIEFVPAYRSVPEAPAAELETTRKAQWLQVMSHLSPQFGGIAVSVPRLAKATEAAGAHACPLAGFCERDELEHVPEDQRAGMTVFPPSRIRWVVDKQLRGGLREMINGATGVHIHGVWETHCMAAAGIARDCNRPYIISAHGMLEQWALRSKRLKKALYAALVELRRMQRATCLRALSVDEVDDYRRLGLMNPIAIIPNGIDARSGATPDLFWRTYPQLSGKRIVLFLGRLHPKKGLQLLLEAWAGATFGTDDVHLVIAGPDSENTRATLERIVDEYNLQHSVTFPGMLMGEQKWSALAAASLFVLPSYSEGFSIAVLEALSLGVPVVVTRPCHIPEVATHDCGWVISPAVDPLQQVLSDFLALSCEEAQQIGNRGRGLVRARFHSSVVGKQMAEVYDWLQGGLRPSTVEIV
jgi:glycosyltransferase involved in cell wall biosynthesis